MGYLALIEEMIQISSLGLFVSQCLFGCRLL